MSTKPRLQALILAEHVYTDFATGKRVVAGTFNAIYVQTFPAHVAMPASVYISVTDVRRGRTELTLRIVDTEDLSVVMETGPVEVVSKDPHDTAEFGIPIPGFFLPHAGVYDLELYADGDRLGSLRIVARVASKE